MHPERASRALCEPGQVVNERGAPDGVANGVVANVPEERAGWPAHADTPLQIPHHTHVAVDAGP
eukprot:1238056-Lingulodinium_polyedra.AAC.1